MWSLALRWLTVLYAQVLASLPWLRNLNLKGCKLARSDDYPQSILRMLPHLEVLDNQRVAERNKQPRATVRSVNAGGPAGPQNADLGQSQPMQRNAETPHRKDRTKTASTSAKESRGSPEGDKKAQYMAEPKRKKDAAIRAKDARDCADNVGTREDFQDAVAGGLAKKKKKKRAVSEGEEPLGRAVGSKQIGVLEGEVQPNKKQRKPNHDRGSEQGRAAAAGSAEKDPAKGLPAADQGFDVPGMTPAHRPPVVGVFEARRDARKGKKVAALARGAQVCTGHYKCK